MSLKIVGIVAGGREEVPGMPWFKKAVFLGGKRT